jgi:hypothetical protein
VLEQLEVVLAVLEGADAGVQMVALVEPVVILEPVEQARHGLILVCVWLMQLPGLAEAEAEADQEERQLVLLAEAVVVLGFMVREATEQRAHLLRVKQMRQGKAVHVVLRATAVVF